MRKKSEFLKEEFLGVDTPKSEEVPVLPDMYFNEQMVALFDGICHPVGMDYKELHSATFRY